MATIVRSGTLRGVLKELDFRLDGFGEQQYLTEAMSSAKQILLLLFMRPGDYPSMPELGINISKEIRYKDLDVITGGKLRQDIMNQIKTYSPNVGLEDLTIHSTNYKGQFILIMDFQLVAEQTISIALTENRKRSIIDFKVEFG